MVGKNKTYKNSSLFLRTTAVRERNGCFPAWEFKGPTDTAGNFTSK